MRTWLFILCLTVICLIACKKETTNPVVYPPATNNLAYAGSFLFIKVTYLNITNSFKNIAAYATFSDRLLKKDSVDVGAVSYNDHRLQKLNNSLGQVNYVDTSGAIMGQPFHMRIDGAGSFSASEFIYNQGFPTYADSSAMPHDITCSAGFNFTMTNVTSTDSVFITLGPTPVTKGFAVANNRAVILFSAAELSSIHPGSSGSSGTISYILRRKSLSYAPFSIRLESWFLFRNIIFH